MMLLMVSKGDNQQRGGAGLKLNCTRSGWWIGEGGSDAMHDAMLLSEIERVRSRNGVEEFESWMISKMSVYVCVCVAVGRSSRQDNLCSACEWMPVWCDTIYSLSIAMRWGKGTLQRETKKARLIYLPVLTIHSFNPQTLRKDSRGSWSTKWMGQKSPSDRMDTKWDGKQLCEPKLISGR